MDMNKDIQPHGRPSLDELIAMRGRPVLTVEGVHVGDIETVFYDDKAYEPEWIGARVEQGIFTELTGTHHVVIPFSGAYIDDDINLRVPYTQHEVRDAPRYDPDWEVIPEDVESDLYDHYTLLTIERRRKAELKAGAEEEMAEAAINQAETPGLPMKDLQRPTYARSRLRRWVQLKPLAPETGAPPEALEDEDAEDKGAQAA